MTASRIRTARTLDDPPRPRARRARSSSVPAPIARGGWISVVVVAVVFLFAPQGLSEYQLSSVAVAIGYGVAALGVAVAFSAFGVLALNQSAVMAVGGYVCVELTSNFHVPFLLALVAAAAAGAVISGLFAALTIGLSNLAFAILGFAFTYLVNAFLNGTLLQSISGGELGRVFPPVVLAGQDLTQGVPDYYFLLIVTAVCFASVGLWLRSSAGRVMFVVGNGETMATVVGLRVRRTKMLGLAVVGALGGLGGALVSQASGYIAPTTFTPTLSVLLLAMALIGGTRYLFGALLGAMLLQALPQMGTFQATTTDILVAAALLLVLIALREGLLGGIAELVELLKTRKR